ncbi:hypothetical protein [Klebsiella aerogenes]|uniref:bestrophin-like domain n=1 Tax=Klebsiella aerogenes TaxID=548 RepID=UPI002FF89679
MAFFLTMPAADDVLLLVVTGVLLTLFTWSGRLMCRVSRPPDRPVVDGVMTTAILALTGLLIGGMFLMSVRGYVAREAAGVREAQDVEVAWQYLQLLPSGTREKVQPLLKTYIGERIRFYRDDTPAGARGWASVSEANQRRQWQLVTPEAARAPTPVMALVLSAFSALTTSELKTCAVWKRQVPDAAWLVLFAFATASCFLAGVSAGGEGNLSLLLMPGLVSLVLFVVAETDMPGQGIIRVTPDALEHLESVLALSRGEPPHDLARPVHHVP